MSGNLFLIGIAGLRTNLIVTHQRRLHGEHVARRNTLIAAETGSVLARQ